MTFASLRRQLGIVPQEPFLFAGTIGDNIKFAKPTATREEILEACDKVGITSLIDALPDGLDTPCHERGVTLSSGERQLIALARAFLASPRVLILDEATSNLDLQTESLVERALDVLLEGRTAVLIAHRLNTAMRADRIAVVDDGRLVEIGSHAELVARNGRYAEMFAAWRRRARGGPGHRGAVGHLIAASGLAIRGLLHCRGQRGAAGGAGSPQLVIRSRCRRPRARPVGARSPRSNGRRPRRPRRRR